MLYSLSVNEVPATSNAYQYTTARIFSKIHLNITTTTTTTEQWYKIRVMLLGSGGGDDDVQMDL